MLPDEVCNKQRRSADVFLPSWSAGSPVTLDFAVTTPQRQVTLTDAARHRLAAASSYSDHKRAYLNTEGLCADAGIAFIPMVAETTGAWAPDATKVLKQLAASSATLTGTDPDIALQHILQNAAIRIRRANARASLRRSADAPAEADAHSQRLTAQSVLEAM